MKFKLRNDIILIVSILLLALACFWVYKANQKEGNMVKVTVDKQLKDCYNFNKDAEVVITTGDKNQYQNVLVIKDGQAFIKSANCPDKICVKHHKISKTGETIVCLPHKLVVEIAKE